MAGRTAQTPTAAAPVSAIREQFPALRRLHGGAQVAYMDGPGGTQVPRQVLDAMNAYLMHHNANTHWRYPTSEETDQLIASARQTLADFVNATPEEISFGQNMTTITFHLARALGRNWGPGDEVVITELDHHANVAPWRALERERGITIRTVRMDPRTGQLVGEDLERHLTDRTRLLAIGAASNAIGTVTDVRAATALAHERGAQVFVDAVHAAPHMLMDVQEIGCEYMACSAYKFYGPHVGVLYARRDRLEALDVPKLDPAPDNAPERLETGTQNHEGIVGAAAAVEFLASLAGPVAATGTRRDALRATFGALHQRGEALLARLWEGLSGAKGVTLYGVPPGQPRTPTLGFTVKGRTADDVAVSLATRGLFASHGDFYAATVIERLGLGADGLVRVGCSCYTTMEEIERTVEALA